MEQSIRKAGVLQVARDQRRVPEKDLQTEAERISMVENLRFAAVFHAALPRELRDEVYKHLGWRYDQDTEKPRWIWTEGPYQPSTENIPHNCGHPIASRQSVTASLYTTERAERLDHWFKEAYVGPTIAKEIIESYYRNANFYVRDLEILPRFFAEDQFGAGFVPRDLVRHITIAAQPLGVPFSYLSDEEDDVSREIFLRQLEAIFELRNKNACVEFDLLPGFGDDYPSQLERDIMVLENQWWIASIVYRLHEAGFRVISQCRWGGGIYEEGLDFVRLKTVEMHLENLDKWEQVISAFLCWLL